jgi:FkbM family methyltransferase
MTSSVYIKTFQPDLKWIQWCFRFLKKNWKTDSEFVICAPHDCNAAIQVMQELLGHPLRLAPMDQWDENGYVHQQYMKMNADLYCDGDLITYIDSDAMLVMPTDLDKDLCVDGKPIIWQTRYDKIQTPWQNIVAGILGLQPQYEYMRAFPFTYWRETVKCCREHVEKIHGKPLHEVMRPTRFWSEFNVMGFYARVFQSDRYVWKDTEEMFLQKNKEHHWHDRVRQFHNIIDWHKGTIPFLRDLYGEPIADSAIDLFSGRVVTTPLEGQQALIDRILPHIKKNALALDVGAHEGLHAKAYQNAGAVVYAFEPVPASFIKLWDALWLGGGTALRFAVGEQDGTVFLKEVTECSEASFIGSEGEPVPCVSLDSFFSKDNVPPEGICVLKIDTEGFEPLVLRGAKNIIETYHPVIIVECQRDTLKRAGFTRSDIEDFLTGLGYSMEISMTDPRASTGEVYFFDIIATP